MDRRGRGRRRLNRTASPLELTARVDPSWINRAAPSLRMAETTALAAAAADAPSSADLERVQSFTREPVLLAGETLADLAPGTARRLALDAALAEIEEGLEEPSPDWRGNFSLLLGLERVLAEDEPKLLDGAELSEHQVDALSGTLAAIISEIEDPGSNANGNGDRQRGRGGHQRRRRRGRARRGRGAAGLGRGGSRRRGGGDRRRGARRSRRLTPVLVRARDRRRQDRRRGRLRRGIPHRRHPDPHPPPQPRRPVHRRDLRPRLRRSPLAAAAARARTTPTARSRSRPTSGSSATPARSRTPTRS